MNSLLEKISGWLTLSLKTTLAKVEAVPEIVMNTGNAVSSKVFESTVNNGCGPGAKLVIEKPVVKLPVTVIVDKPGIARRVVSIVAALSLKLRAAEVKPLKFNVN